MLKFKFYFKKLKKAFIPTTSIINVSVKNVKEMLKISNFYFVIGLHKCKKKCQNDLIFFVLEGAGGGFFFYFFCVFLIFALQKVVKIYYSLLTFPYSWSIVKFFYALAIFQAIKSHQVYNFFSLNLNSISYSIK